MFACWCSEMIYYTCNMKHARGCCDVSTLQYTDGYCFFNASSCTFNVVAKISPQLPTRYEQFFTVIDIMLHGSFENINKTSDRAEWSETEIGSSIRTSRHGTSQTHDAIKLMCIYSELDVWGIFFFAFSTENHFKSVYLTCSFVTSHLRCWRSLWREKKREIFNK